MGAIKEESIIDSSYESLSEVNVSHALVTNVEFSSGKTSSIVTLFNCSDFSFEEIKIGVDTSLHRQNWLGIANKGSTLYRFINGKIKKVCSWI